MRRLIYLSLFITLLIPNSLWAQPIPTSPWYYSNGNTAHSKPGVETVVIGGTSQGSLQLYDTTGLNKVTVLTESVLGADFIVTLPISGDGGCDPSALASGDVLYVASGACAGNAKLAWNVTEPRLRVGDVYAAALAADTPGISMGGNETLGNQAMFILSSSTNSQGSPLIRGLSARGTIAAPALSGSGDRVLSILGESYNGSFNPVGRIEFAVDDAAPDDGRLTFFTTTLNAEIQRLRIDSAANVSIGPGAASAAPIQFAYDDNSDGSNSPYIYLRNTAVGGYAGMSFKGHTVSDAFASIDANGSSKAATVTLNADGTTGVNANSFQGSTGFQAQRNSGSGGSVSMTIDGTGGTAGNAALLILAPPGGATSLITAESGTGGAKVEAYTDNDGDATLSARTTSLTHAPKLNIIYNSGGGGISTYALIHDPVGIITEYRSPLDHVFTWSGTETVRFSTGGVVTMKQLKTTGAATGKKIVCVDTATGILYASSSGVACAN